MATLLAQQSRALALLPEYGAVSPASTDICVAATVLLDPHNVTVARTAAPCCGFVSAAVAIPAIAIFTRIQRCPTVWLAALTRLRTTDPSAAAVSAFLVRGVSFLPA